MMTIETRISIVKRELLRRKRIFPHLIKSGKITQKEADFEIAGMQSVLETLTQLMSLL